MSAAGPVDWTVFCIAVAILLAGALQHLRFLRTGLALILLFAAARMLVAGMLEISAALSLGVVMCIFAGSVAASRRFPARAGDSRA